MALISLIVLIPVYIYYGYRQYVYADIETIETAKTVIVFGAAIYGPDAPSAPLKDRIEMAAQLYEAGKVSKIIVSGDGTQEYYDEPTAMKNALIKLNVPEDIIIKDKYGIRTYDTCYRAKNIFGVADAILVSQGFHLPRALFLCRELGINAEGVYATGAFSSGYSRWNIVREIAAMYNAFLDLTIIHPTVNESTN